MTQIVINTDFGGFGLSDEAVFLYFQKKGWGVHYKKQETHSEFFKIVDGQPLPDILFKEYIDLTDDERDQYNTAYEEYGFFDWELERDDAVLLEVVKELGAKANGWASRLKIVTIPDDVDWGIHEYDGREHIYEKHRTWC